MSQMSLTTSLIRYDNELKRRLEKLARTYDLTTMKIFIAVECLGEELVMSTYNSAKKARWEPFLNRKEACRLDLQKHEKNRNHYMEFLKNVSHEHQGQQFYTALLKLLKQKGAVDMFQQLNTKSNDTSELSFCGILCRLFERKIESWFETFEAVAIKLTGHIKVSNFVRLLTGQVDFLCCKDGKTYAVNIKVMSQDTPRPLDVAELAMCKILIIQNGLANPTNLLMYLLVLHLTEERPILRLWEYLPTKEMEVAICEADIDKLIDAGKLSQYHEFWKDNVHKIGIKAGDKIL